AAGAAAVALLGRQAGTGHGRVIGGLSTTLGIALLPATAGALGAALDWPEAAVIPAMMGAASLGLGVAAALRFSNSGYVRYGVAGVSVATAVTTLTVLFTDQPTGVYAAVSGLIGVAGGMLLLPSRRDAAIGNCATASLPFAVAIISALPGVFSVLQPYLWALWFWQGAGDGTRTMLTPGAQDLGFAPGPIFPDGWDPLTLLLITIAAGVAAHGLRGARWVFPAVLPGAVAVLLVTPVAYDWPWPALPVVALGLAVGAGLVAGLLPRTGVRTTPTVVRATSVIWPVTGSIGLANCLATPLATLAGLTAGTAAATLVALLGRTTLARVFGWIVAGSGAALLASAAGKHAGLTQDQRAYGILGVALLLLVAAAALPGRRPDMLTTEVMSYLVAFYAVAIAAPEWLTVAIVLAGYGAMLGLSAVRPGRWKLVFGAAGCELVAWWIFLGTRDVGLVEAYTVPFAAAALLGGVLTLRHRPQLDSWRAYGLALAAGFVPSVGVMFGSDLFGADHHPWRRLGIGVAAVVVVIAGAVRRRQAPVVVGGVVLVLSMIRELIGLWDVLPRWVPLAAAGLLLLALGATYEQRRRDVRTLREALSRMT
ncbi:MAG: SCO7613 C-terminal domain-containing membrane protein, partial [Micromonosporaceae bacterium]